MASIKRQPKFRGTVRAIYANDSVRFGDSGPRLSRATRCVVEAKSVRSPHVVWIG